MECPLSKRCYLYCPLHELHCSHSSQTSSRRTNTPVITVAESNTASCSGNNSLLLEDSSCPKDGYNNAISNNDINPRQRRKRRSRDEEEVCMCGCNQLYNSTSIVDCKGTNCMNRVNFSCVPNTWLCKQCK
jgi:hypothetical protein